MRIPRSSLAREGLTGRRLLAAIALLGALAAFLLVPLEASPRAGAADTWEGVWDTDQGRLTLGAGGSGTSLGYYPGTISGTITGNVLEGTWTQASDPPKSGTFKWTLSGRSFTGDWAYSTGGCGIACGWSGTCIEGACLANGGGGTTTTPTTPTTTTPTTTPDPDTRVTLSVKAPNGAYGASAQVANGTTVRFHVAVSPSLPAGASVVVEYPWQGGVSRLFECSTRVCENTTNYKNAKIAFHAAVVKDGRELARSGTVSVTWAKRAPAVSATLSVKAPNGRFASLTQADVGKTVVLRAAVTPRLPAGARLVVRTRQLGATREFVLGGAGYTCTRNPCDFSAQKGEAETWQFRVLVMRGSVVLASSPYIKVVWCYCHVKKRLYVDVVYNMDDFDPVYSRTPICQKTAEPLDQDRPGVVAGAIKAQILFRKRVDYYDSVTGKFLGTNYTPGEPVTGPTTDFGDFHYGDLPYDLDELGRKIWPEPPTRVCFGTGIDLRMIPRTARLVVTPTERALAVKVRVVRTDVPGNVCAGSIATLRMVDSDVSLGKFTDAPGLNKAATTRADSISITGFSPACPHEHSFDMHTPGFFPPNGRPGNWSGPWAEFRVTLTCAPPPGAPGRGISTKECPLDS